MVVFAKYLLENNGKLGWKVYFDSETDNNCENALIVAARNSDIKAMKVLLESKMFDVNYKQVATSL